MGALLGYARVSTGGQELALQHDALTAAGCGRVFSDTATGSLSDRPELARVLDHLREGDTLIVWRLDRLGRSLRHLIDTVTALADRGVGFRSIRESIDTTTPGGRLIFHVFAALAEFESDLIRERTQAGLTAARARGRNGGRPTVMTPAKLTVARQMHDSHEHTLATIAAVVGVSRATIYRALATPSSPADPGGHPPVHAQPEPPARVDPEPTKAHPEPAQASSSPLSTRRARAARRVMLPNSETALQHSCPRCAAEPGVMCRDTRSKAKRRPAAPKIHVARYWLDRRCTTCHALPGEPCRAPDGTQTTKVHTPRLRPSQAEADARRLVDDDDRTSAPLG